MTINNHDCLREEQFTNLEQRLTRNEEKVQTITSETTRLEKTLDKLDATQDNLTVEIAKLNTAFHTIKYLIGIAIALFGTIFTFLITELIKLI